MVKYPLPKGWRWVRLGEVCETLNGVWGQRDERGYPVLRSTNFTDQGDLLFDDVARVLLTPKQREKALLRENDILLERSGGGPKKPVGRVCLFVDGPEPGGYYFGNFITVLRIVRAGIDARFVFHYLRWFHISGQTERLQTQTTNIRNLRFREYLETPLPLPPLPEQRRIVARIEALMERIREAERLRQQARDEAERLWQSVLADIFPRPGSDLPSGWRWVRLGEVAKVFSGVWGENPPAKNDTAKTVRVIRVSDIRPDLQIEYSSLPIRVVKNSQAKRYQLQDGDLVVVKSSGSKAKVISGRTALFRAHTKDVIIPSNFTFGVRPRLSTIQPRFLWAWLNSDAVKRIVEQLVSTFTYPNLKKKDYESLPVPLPPLPEQRRVVARLEAVQEKVHALKVAQEETEKRLKQLEQSILEKAFRGKL